jgi:hypothetical protein
MLIILQLDVATIATPGVVTTSGSASGAAFQINIGTDATAIGNGWGAAAWGFSTWNTPRPTGVITANPRIWQIDNFGEDILATIVGGKTYYFDTSAFLPPRNTRATLLANAPTQSNFMTISPRDRHVIFFGTQTTPGTTQLMIQWPCSSVHKNQLRTLYRMQRTPQDFKGYHQVIEL